MPLVCCARLERWVLARRVSRLYWLHCRCHGYNPTLTHTKPIIAQFGTAGRIQRKLAVWYEEDRNFDEAIDQFRQASDYYLGDNMINQSDLCLLKCAYYQGLMEEFEDAAEIYATVGMRCLDSNLTKFNAREHFLRCGLLYMAGGPHMHNKLKRKLMDFKTGDASFAFSRECLFLEVRPRKRLY